MQKLLLLGDEAIAQAAIDAGISGIFSYPGTPSTEITEYIQNSKEAKEKGIRSAWGCNEKTAVEAAIGMCYAGKRVMTCMKHVGLNVAADPFMNVSITGTNGGMIIVAADDPSMHSSQNEQDSRFFGHFSLIPVLEPSNQQEAYDMVHYGYELSEKLKTPVMLRITTRMAHSRAGVARIASRAQNEMKLPDNKKQFILLPAIARAQYKSLLEKQTLFTKESEQKGFNQYFDGTDKKLGIITTGIAFNYLRENYPDGKVPYPVVKVTQYPLPHSMIQKLYDECNEILVLEEGQPLVEEQIKGFLAVGKKVKGRLDNTIQRDGELSPAKIARALGLPVVEGSEVPSLVAARPPALCAGCPHIDSYNALNEAIAEYGDGRVFADIGCYTLGFMAPYNAINTCVDMGASITMAKGACEAGLFPTVAVIGDSTFTHSGMTGLLDAVNDNIPITVFILDNSTTGMTGGQKSSASGRIEAICAGIGVHPDHIRIMNPLKRYHEENLKIVKEELAYRGVSVIIPRRDCIVAGKRMRKEKAKNEKTAN